MALGQRLLVALGTGLAVSLWLSQLKKRFQRGACAAVRVAFKELCKAKSEVIVVTWFSKRSLTDAEELVKLLDPRVELRFVSSGRWEDVDRKTQVLVSSDAEPFEVDPGGLETLPALEAFLQPYAGVPEAASRGVDACFFLLSPFSLDRGSRDLSLESARCPRVLGESCHSYRLGQRAHLSSLSSRRKSGYCFSCDGVLDRSRPPKVRT